MSTEEKKVQRGCQERRQKKTLVLSKIFHSCLALLGKDFYGGLAPMLNQIENRSREVTITQRWKPE
jgi:hypothetical protein